MMTVRDDIKRRAEKDRRSVFNVCVISLIIIVLLLSVLLLKTYVYMSIQVQGISMNDTLQNKDMLIANVIKAPKDGDVVIIDISETDPGIGWLVKRVIGTGGEYIKIENGKVYRSYNGTDFTELKEEYAKGETCVQCGSGADVHESQTWFVPQGQVFYLGDNRRHSYDARFFGMVGTDKVIGVVDQWVIDTKDIRNFFYYNLSFSSCN